MWVAALASRPTALSSCFSPSRSMMTAAASPLEGRVTVEQVAFPQCGLLIKPGTAELVEEALKDSGRLEHSYYVERASGGERQVISRAEDVDPAAVPYMSLVIMPGPEASGQPAVSGGRNRSV